MARTAYHEKPSVFPGGTPCVTLLKIRFLWKMNRQYEIFFNESETDRIGITYRKPDRNCLFGSVVIIF